jgi:hypothetical protein
MKPEKSNRQRRMTATAAFGILSVLSLMAGAEPLSSVVFDNKSGQAALVKLVGPTTQVVEVPDGQMQSVKAAGGKYYILVRYGDSLDGYRYTRGEPFDVNERETAIGIEYSEITITLHPVINGNYSTAPSSKEEFEKAVVEATPIIGPIFKPVDVELVRPIRAEPLLLKPMDVNLVRFRPVEVNYVPLKVIDVNLAPIRIVDVNAFRPIRIEPVQLRPIDVNLIRLRPIQMNYVPPKAVDCFGRPDYD